MQWTVEKPGIWKATIEVLNQDFLDSKEQCFATVEMLSQLPIRGYAGICVSPDGKIYDKDNMQDAR
jgi:hypothetical protein